MKEKNPIPRVPPVTRAVAPLRDHLKSLQLLSAAGIMSLQPGCFETQYTRGERRTILLEWEIRLGWQPYGNFLP